MDITQIVVAVIGLMTVVITTLIAPLITSKLSDAKLTKVRKYIDIGVAAAEQLLKAVDPTGELRKKYVVDFLVKCGIIADADKVTEAINNMIEASVKALNIEEKKAA